MFGPWEGLDSSRTCFCSPDPTVPGNIGSGAGSLEVAPDPTVPGNCNSGAHDWRYPEVSPKSRIVITVFPLHQNHNFQEIVLLVQGPAIVYGLKLSRFCQMFGKLNI